MNYYIKTDINFVIHINKIYSFHYFEYVKEFKGIGEKHDFWELVYIDYGKIKVISDEEEFVLKAGEGFLHQPNEFHNIFTFDDFASVFIISFECKDDSVNFLRKRILKFYGIESQIVGYMYKAGEESFVGPYDIMDQQKVKIKSSQPFGAEQIVILHLEWLLIELIRNVLKSINHWTNSIASAKSDKQAIVGLITQILLDAVYEKITLDEICTKLRFSKSYISKLFKDIMGCSIMDFYDQIKIKEAKRLISENKYTFTQIAQRLNYSSIHYFSKHFKEITNMTPSGYQKSVRSRLLI